MRKANILLAAALVGLSLVGLRVWAQEESLAIGSDAPPLTVSDWVKGEKVEQFEDGNVYVVEFWATWCGPCRVSIPHLTELQKQHGDQVTIIGVSVWEEDQDQVAPFVERMGDQMDYRVALDDLSDETTPQGQMAAHWMEAAGQGGIPTAFIINQEGKVAWIGHPMAMDEPLEKIIAGEWDLDAAVAEIEEAEALTQKLVALVQRVDPLFTEQKFDEALAEINQALTDEPRLEPQLGPTKLNLLLATGQDDQALEYGEALAEGTFRDEPQALNFIAWSLVSPDRDRKANPDELKLAMKAAERANTLTGGEDPNVLDTLAKVHFDAGHAAKAVELQEKAVELVGGQAPELNERLEQYRKAVDEQP